jgi:alpha-galactosidase
MRKILDEVDRDIVYSLCQYGMRKVWTWGENVGGNLWRTTGDINDSWESLSKIGFKQAALAPHAGPGHWNDPDMLVVGKVGWGPTLHETKLNKTEQMTHITMWAMLAAPLLIGCDMSNLDRFTLDLLTNDEVIDVDQDPLGKQAQSKASSAESEVWAKPLWDGTLAVALFNKTAQAATVTVKWSELGLSGPQPVRDLWQRKELGSFDREFSATVLAHGAVMVKAGRPAP